MHVKRPEASFVEIYIKIIFLTTTVTYDRLYTRLKPVLRVLNHSEPIRLTSVYALCAVGEAAAVWRWCALHCHVHRCLLTCHRHESKTSFEGREKRNEKSAVRGKKTCLALDWFDRRRQTQWSTLRNLN